jgi:hypothetical protein
VAFFQRRKKLFDAFSFTSGNVTVFGWDKEGSKHLQTIIHGKDVDIPMLPVNEGHISSAAFIREPCQPFGYVNTLDTLGHQDLSACQRELQHSG